MIGTILAVGCVAALPWALTKLTRRVKALGLLGPVFLCYVAGIALSFVFSAAGTDLSAVSTFYSVCVLLAIPLILFSADLGAVRRLAKPMLVSFCLGTAAVLAAAALGFVLFRSVFPRPRTAADIAAMLVGMYTGGTPNTLAIGKALGSGDTILLLQTADILGGGVYFLLLVSVLPRLFGRLLPPYRKTGLSGQDISGCTQEVQARGAGRPYVLGIVRSALLALGCAAVSASLTLLLPPEAGQSRFSNLDRYTAVVMLAVTTLGVALSFSRKVRALPGSYAAGQYLIYMFSAGMGLCFDMTRLGDIAWVLAMELFVEFGAVGLHLLLARLGRIDRDTMMITSTAGVFGPAFIIPVATALENDEIVLPGILCGILGYAVGNYLGIGVGALLLGLL